MKSDNLGEDSLRQEAGMYVCGSAYSMCVLSSHDRGLAALLVWVKMELSLKSRQQRSHDVASVNRYKLLNLSCGLWNPH